MRVALPLCFLIACASVRSPPPAAPARPPMDVNATLNGWRVRFTAPGSWRLDPKLQSKEAIILASVDKPDTILGLIVEEAEIGSTAEGIAGKWQALLVLSKIYDIDQLGRVTARSEEDAMFWMRGHQRRVPLTVSGVVHVASGHGRAVWVIVFAVTPQEHGLRVFSDAVLIAHSLVLKAHE